MNYFSPQFEDKNILINGFTGLWFINRPYHIKEVYEQVLKKLKLNGINENDIFYNLINDTDQLISKIDDYNFLTKNTYPYSKPNNAYQYIYWTKNNNTHHDVYKKLIKLGLINNNTHYMIWRNSHKTQSIKTIKHYHIIIKKPSVYILNIIPSNRLNKIIIIARHGPREPILHLPKLETFNTEIDITKHLDNHIIDAQLTEHGIKYCKNFGQYINKIFSPYFDFDPKKTLIGSSNIHRTIHSALYFYEGLFELNINRSSCKIFRELMGDIILSEDDKIEYIKIHNNMKLTSITSDINKEIYNCFGYKIQNIKDYFNVISTIKVYQEHNIKLPIEWTPELNKLLETIATEYYYELFSTKFKNIFTKNLIQLIEKIIIDPNINFAYLSTHDVVVYPLARQFINYFIKLPDFCSSVRIELWDTDARIYYDDSLIKHLE